MRDQDLIPAHIMESDSLAVSAAQSAADLKNAMKRHIARMAHFAAWVEPEAIKARVERHNAEAEAALACVAHLKRDHLPLPDPLPKHMVGQSPSTIQAMLRSGWTPDD